MGEILKKDDTPELYFTMIGSAGKYLDLFGDIQYDLIGNI